MLADVLTILGWLPAWAMILFVAAFLLTFGLVMCGGDDDSNAGGGKNKKSKSGNKSKSKTKGKG